MIRTCKNCGGRVAFDVELKGLACASCGTLWDVSDFGEEDMLYNEEEPNKLMEDDTFDCSVYQCGSCGAEISITNTEVSTFCIYCGNPSIVFSRVSKMKKPDSILPFKITKEQAMAAVRERISKGFFIPKEIKNYEIEHMRGIYIPYYITNVEYDASYITSSVHKKGKNSVTYYYKRSGYASMPWVTTDASTTLSDSTSQRLEPYNLKETRTFDEDYLVGFYADASDVESASAISLAKKRASNVFEDEIMKSFTGTSKKIVRKRQRAEVYTKPVTSMLPAWFLTFRYNNQPYTIIVNGQTGKIVGGVPWNKGLFAGLVAGIGLVASIVFIPILSIIFASTEGDDSFKLFLFLALAAGSAFISGTKHISKVLKSIERTSASTLTKFVSNRQKGG